MQLIGNSRLLTNCTIVIPLLTLADYLVKKMSNQEVIIAICIILELEDGLRNTFSPTVKYYSIIDYFLLHNVLRS